MANPDDLNLRTALCLSSHYAESMTPDQVRGVHDAYNATLARQLRTDRTPFANTRDPNRKLRIGLVSGDLRRHSVAFFVEPLLQHADTSAFEYIAFSTAIKEDDYSQRLKKHFAAWHSVAALTYDALAAKMRSQAIDILVDLSGHTSNHSLVTFHQRGAPVQVTMIGYPGTTGLTQMDARIVDHLTDPPEADKWHSERLVRLDGCFLCYRPPEDAPAPVARPTNTPITFGSFNVLRKLGDHTLQAWAQILHQVPESRLLLKAQGLSQPAAQAAIRDRFKALGIDETRVELIAYTPTLKEHLDLYARMDIALDPLVYNGTTTTCEALWMGVPVLTMRGNAHASRVGTSLLSCIGAPELIAADTADYIARAVALARNPGALDTYRHTLRAKLQSSPACNGPGYARRVEAAFRALWAAWCAAPLN
jgi:predicted O-linked N-acetylglucosamine transferase (SPINDLY family)